MKLSEEQKMLVLSHYEDYMQGRITIKEICKVLKVTHNLVGNIFKAELKRRMATPPTTELKIAPVLIHGVWVLTLPSKMNF